MKPMGVFDSIQAKQGLEAKNLSQMSYISEHGMSSSEAEKIEAKAKRKQEVRLRNLQKVEAFLQKMNPKLASIQVSDRSSQIAILSKSISSIDRMVASENCPLGVSAPMRKLRNDLVSIREHVTSSRGTMKASHLTCKQLPVAAASIQDLISAARMRLEASDDLVQVRNEYDDAFRDAEKILRKNSDAAKRLDSIKDRPFTLVRAPIVVIAEPVVSVEKLKQQGVKADSLAGYTMIHNQMVLGIGPKSLKDAGGSSKTHAENLAKELLVQLRKQVKKKLILVDPVPTRVKNALWFWVADENEVNKLFKAAHGRLNVKRWGFGMNT